MEAQANQLALSLLPDRDLGPVHRFAHDAMGCTWELHVADEDARYAGQAARAAFEEVSRVEQELSRFIAHSDIAHLNALPAGEPLRVGADTLECLELAMSIHAETDGAFDVTVGGLLPTGARSADSERAADRTDHPAPPTGVGMHRLEIDRARHRVTRLAGGVVVDLGGIGKGYAIDRAVAILRDWSIDAALIHAGQSTLYALGHPRGRTGWTVAIRNPQDHSASLGTVCIRNRALSGSGTWVHGHHIIDPRTGRPADGPAGAWALAPSAAVSDALSTAFMVLPPDRVAEYCRGRAEVTGVLYVEESGRYNLLRYGHELDSGAQVWTFGDRND